MFSENATLCAACTDLVKDEYFARVSLDKLLVHQVKYTTRRRHNQVNCNTTMEQRI